MGEPNPLWKIEPTAHVERHNERRPPAHFPEGAFPPIITLCGSTRFMDTFHAEGWRLALAGIVVLTVGVCTHAPDHGAEALGGYVKERLDWLHRRKIDLSDGILALNVCGYIGESTQREIDYALATGKAVDYLNPRTARPKLAPQAHAHLRGGTLAHEGGERVWCVDPACPDRWPE